MFLKERGARNRRTSTLICFESVLNCHLLPTFGPREVGTIRRSDIAEHFDAMREKSATVQTINRTLRAMKAVLFFALERELVERNVMQRFRPFEGGQSERHVSRGAYSEAEAQPILSAARPHERALIGLLTLAGLRSGEAYALDWESVDLEGGCARVVRSWDHRGGKFVEPKTKAGSRVVPLSGWLVAELSAHKDRSGGEGPVSPTRTGRPMNPYNVRRDISQPLKKRAGARELDLYSLTPAYLRELGSHGRGECVQRGADDGSLALDPRRPGVRPHDAVRYG